MFRSAFYTILAVGTLVSLGFATLDYPVAEDFKGSETDTYTVDRAHSAVSFRVRHLGISNVRGEFTDFDASVSFGAEDLTTLEVNAVIQASSVDTGVERRDADLRSENFFHVEEHPTITFESSTVKNVNGSEFDLVGNLTMHGVTKEVVLAAEFFGAAGDKAGFTASTKILRKEFGLTWDRVTDAGSVVVANEVTITIDLELNKQ